MELGSCRECTGTFQLGPRDHLRQDGRGLVVLGVSRTGGQDLAVGAACEQDTEMARVQASVTIAASILAGVPACIRSTGTSLFPATRDQRLCSDPAVPD